MSPCAASVVATFENISSLAAAFESIGARPKARTKVQKDVKIESALQAAHLLLKMLESKKQSEKPVSGLEMTAVPSGG